MFALATDTKCPSCDGAGQWGEDDPCTVCKATGLVGFDVAERFADERAREMGI